MKLFFKIFFSIIGLYLFLFGLLYINQASLIFQSTHLDPDHKYNFKSDFEEFNLLSKDKKKLNALYFKSDNPKGMILYFHGNAGDLSRWGKIVEPLLTYNYDVLIMDYRGYGKSVGEPSSKMLYEDGLLFYEKAKKYYSENQIIVYGRSLGSSVATYVASRNSPQKLILETPFYSLQSVVNDTYPIFPTSYLLKHKFPTYKFIDEVSCPIYTFHGTDDAIVPYENGKLLMSLSNSIELITIEGGGHNDLLKFETYWLKLQNILEPLQ